MRAHLDMWATGARMEWCRTGKQYSTAPVEASSRKICWCNVRAPSPPWSSDMARLHVPESKSKTGAAKARPAEQGLETKRQCGRVVGAS